ncbi:MAG: hypothetical protein LBU40_00415, partial [Methanobrevibacter sp.]|nr:hypothetical protein [Methanobrevibacter sp.]
RVGFPIFDRLGTQRISYFGYNGSIKFVDSMTNMILDYYYDEEGYKIAKEEFQLDFNENKEKDNEMLSIKGGGK